MATWLYVLVIKELIFNFLNFLLMEGKVHQVYMHADEAIIPVTVTLINYNHIASNLFVCIFVHRLPVLTKNSFTRQVCLARDLATEVYIFSWNLYLTKYLAQGTTTNNTSKHPTPPHPINMLDKAVRNTVTKQELFFRNGERMRILNSVETLVLREWVTLLPGYSQVKQMMSNRWQKRKWVSHPETKPMIIIHKFARSDQLIF